VILVLGGARSGKSRFALRRAEALALPPLLVATGEPGDEEMAARIERHRADRGDRWPLVEEPRRVAGVLRREEGRAIVLDCLTLWVANVLGEPPSPAIGSQIDELVTALGSRRNAVVAVANEVGLGIVPATALGRAFRDAAGLLNQKVAEIADEVHLLVAGHPLRIK
jgi:adenosylcobinamide kinase/adenosylcobinamide-phosphate guanylyltransferase